MNIIYVLVLGIGCALTMTSTKVYGRSIAYFIESSKAKDGDHGIPGLFEDGGNGQDGENGISGQHGGHGGNGASSVYGNGGHGGNGGDAD